MSTVVTRFAPSPTGYLHVGGARTALFNWLLARNTGGKYYLRIEDTDRARSTDAAVDAVLEDLHWLGLDWDNADDLMFQSKRTAVYDAIFDDLIARGLAYEAWETREELDNQRQQAQRAKRPYLYPRPGYTDEQVARFKAEGRTPVLRFKMDRERDYFFDDAVLGAKQGLPGNQAQDFVIRKADGMPTYHFAVVVDDNAMGVTHVLRGQEHLLNTCQHIALMDALGYDRPTFAHLPVILKTDGSKMGKRDRDKQIKEAARLFAAADLADKSGLDHAVLETWLADKQAQLDPSDHVKLLGHVNLTEADLPQISVDDFRRVGYLPEVLNNFLALLGWSPGDDRERLSMDELVGLFGLERVGKANAKFDYKKLTAFNTEAAEAASPDRLLSGFKDYLSQNADSPLHTASDAQLAKLLAMSKGFHVFAEVDQKARFFFADDEAISYDDEKANQKFLKKGEPNGLAHLAALQDRLATLDDWSVASLESETKALCEERGVGLGKVAQPARIAVAGGPVSPPIFDTLAFLGKQRTLTRMKQCLATVKA
jgi:glutamyl-tRNA synthetase